MHMAKRTTLILKEELVKSAMEATGIREKTALVHRGLEELLRSTALERLAALGGSDPKAEAAPRRPRSSSPRKRSPKAA